MESRSILEEAHPSSNACTTHKVTACQLRYIGFGVSCKLAGSRRSRQANTAPCPPLRSSACRRNSVSLTAPHRDGSPNHVRWGKRSFKAARGPQSASLTLGTRKEGNFGNQNGTPRSFDAPPTFPPPGEAKPYLLGANGRLLLHRFIEPNFEEFTIHCVDGESRVRHLIVTLGFASHLFRFPQLLKHPHDGISRFKAPG